MKQDVLNTLTELLEQQRKEKNASEREIKLVSLGPWENDMDFASTAEELNLIFESFLEELRLTLGQAVYAGPGPRKDQNLTQPQKYFEEYESTLRLSWWEFNDIEVMLMITGHDADTLQFIHLAVSSIARCSNSAEIVGI